MAKSIGFNIVLSANGQKVVVNCKKGVEDHGRALGTNPGASRKAGDALRTTGAIATSLNDFLDKAKEQGPKIIENELAPEIDNAANDRLQKAGWT